MDWLAGSRLHLVDAVVTRGLTYVPIFVLGFPQDALIPYVFIVAAQATFIHANVRWEFRSLRLFIATPAFHHWHHSAEREAIDRNFAVHTPVCGPAVRHLLPSRSVACRLRAVRRAGRAVPMDDATHLSISSNHPPLIA